MRIAWFMATAVMLAGCPHDWESVTPPGDAALDTADTAVGPRCPLAPTTGLLAHWSFDEGSGLEAADLSGRANRGTISGAAWTAGRLDGALLFDGVDDFVDVSSVSTDLAAITVTAWINPTSFTQDGRIFSKASAPDHAAHDVMLSTTEVAAGVFHLRARLNTGGVVQLVVGTARITSQRWTHVALTYNGTIVRLYQDGMVVGSAAGSGRVGNTQPNARIGQNPDGYGPFHGAIDDVRIYDSALDPAQVQTLFECQ